MQILFGNGAVEPSVAVLVGFSVKPDLIKAVALEDFTGNVVITGVSAQLLFDGVPLAFVVGQAFLLLRSSGVHAVEMVSFPKPQYFHIKRISSNRLQNNLVVQHLASGHAICVP